MRQNLFCQFFCLGAVLASTIHISPATAEMQEQGIKDNQLEVASDVASEVVSSAEIFMETSGTSKTVVAQKSTSPTNSTPKSPIYPPVSAPINATPRFQSRISSQVLTVVRGDATEWNSITATLRGVNYKFLPLESLNKQALADVKLLLLPNLQTLTVAQVETLSEWIISGGKLIVTGPVGLKSSPDVQAKLRSLLGAYWDGTLGEPTNLLVRSDMSYSWALSVPKVNTTTVDSGGTLKSSSSKALPVAYWSNNSAAVLANQNILFLGWQWGMATERQAYDRSWLIAATNRLSVNDNANNAIATRPGLSNSTNSTNSTNPTTSPTSNLSPEPRISTFEETSMRQDIQELIGRIESRIVSNQVANTSFKPTSTPIQSIAIAKQFLQAMPTMLREGRYGEVRTQWQQNRQNLWKDYPTTTLSALPEVRAIWLDRGTIVAARSERQLALVFDRMAAAGINTVFLETVNAGYPIYPSSVAPQQNPLTVGWDPLAAAVKLAHERKMELHAWVWVFSAGNRRHNLLIGKPADYLGPLLSVHPEWANRSQTGEIFAPEGKPFLDPANPLVQEYLLKLYREIVTRYKVDGIHLDYIRYPRQEPGADFGFGVAGRSQFQALTGIDPVDISLNNSSLWWMWTEFRAKQVTQFVGRVSKEMKQIKPDLVISAAVFPWRNIERLTKIQQDWEVWVARGDVDLLVPMTYAPDTSRFLQQEVQPVLKGVAQSPVLILPGVLLRDMQETELLDQLQAVRDLPSGGYSLFAAEHLRPSFERVFRTTKTERDTQILPYRKPFAAAMSRYALLQQEWNALLKMDSISVNGDNLQMWQAQSETLSQALSALNQQPSQANLKTAMLALSKMSTSFPTWMRTEKSERPYRVAAWSNRLGAIAAFLRYGDRTILQSSPTTATTRASNALYQN
jgi:uncharacterized lipoprotein YddW (UPF0748 family)